MTELRFWGAESSMTQASKDSAAYWRALIHADHNRAVEIEKRYGLYGYPPELVSLGLKAAADGFDPETAIGYATTRDET